MNQMPRANAYASLVLSILVLGVVLLTMTLGAADHGLYAVPGRALAPSVPLHGWARVATPLR
jgi:hypothetical protein